MTRSRTPRSSDDDNLITVRAAVVLLAATVFAIIVGVVTFRTEASVGTSFLAADSAWVAGNAFTQDADPPELTRRKRPQQPANKSEPMATSASHDQAVTRYVDLVDVERAAEMYAEGLDPAPDRCRVRPLGYHGQRSATQSRGHHASLRSFRTSRLHR
jgi:hypothetical protein